LTVHDESGSDRPPSLFGWIHDPAVDEMAAGLDRQIATLIDAGIR
jgi:hypothetical protein